MTLDGTRAFDALQFSTDGYLLQGGALAIGPGESPGTLNVDGAVTATIASTITDGSSSDLVKVGGGTLVVSGANTYSGATTVAGGTLRLGADDALPLTTDIALAADGTLDLDSFSQNAASLSGAGALRTGTGTLRLTGATTDVFSGSILGAGSLVRAGTGTTVLTGDQGGFGGLAILEAGRFVVGGVLGGSVEVLGGRLEGSGRVGTLAVGAGGVLAPGNSIGTLTIDGDFTMSAGGVYEVEVDPEAGASDLLVVGGTARLAGSVRHVGRPGSYPPFSEYRILTAAGGLVGAFDDARSDFTFLDAILGYGTTDVTLRLERNDTAFESVATTPRQRATGAALDRLGFGNPVYDALVQLDRSDASAAFDALSGEIHGSIATALVDASGTIRRMVLARPGGGDVFELGAGGAGPLASAWGEAFGSWCRTGRARDASALAYEEAGFLVGFDARVLEDAYRGAFGGYGRVRLVEAGRGPFARAASASVESHHVGMRGGWRSGALRLSAGAAHAWHAVGTSRTVAFPGFSDHLAASFGARTFQAFAEAGFSIEGDGLRLEPFAGVAYVRTDTDRRRELGGAAALKVASGSMATSFTTFGLRVSSRVDFGSVQGTLTAKAGLERALGRDLPDLRLSFAGGDAFTVPTRPIARDTAVVEVGLDLALGDGVSLGFSYDGRYRRGSAAHGVNGRFRVAF